ncbi:MAG: hypothetical protein WED87_01425, partial [Dehalococcoidia bacterium]
GRPRAIAILGGAAALVALGILLVVLTRNGGDDQPASPEQATPTAETSPTTPAGTTLVAVPPGMPSPACTGRATDGTASNWHPHFLRINGRRYVLSGLFLSASTAVADDNAGPQVGEILWNVNDSWTEPCHADLDGSSSIVLPRSPVYALEGFREEFRVVAPISRELHIFESAWREDATTIEELLDIRGKVARVTVIQLHTGGDGDGTTWVLTDPGQVAAFVNRLLAEPLIVPTSGPRAADIQLRTEFQLHDGTTVMRMWISMPPPPDSPVIPASQDVMRSLIAFLESD